MEINISTTFDFIQSKSISAPNEIKSFLRGGLFNDNEFQIQNFQQRFIEVKAGEDIPGPIDIFDFFNVEAGNVTLVHVQVYNQDPEDYNLNNIRFTISLGDVELGEQSQFTMANMKDFASTIVIDSVTVPESEDEDVDRKAVFIIIVGSKND